MYIFNIFNMYNNIYFGQYNFTHKYKLSSKKINSCAMLIQQLQSLNIFKQEIYEFQLY